MDAQLDYQKLAQHVLAQQLALNGGNAGAGLGYKADVGSTPTSIYGHGPGGLFSYPGMDPKVFSAMVLPIIGLQSRLPVFQNNDANPVYGIMTGVTATSGSNPTGPCDDPPTAGLSKLCLHTFQWGLFSRQTRVFNLLRVGEVVSRADFTDYTLYGNGLNVPPDNPMIPTIAGADPANVGRNEMAKATFELAVAWARDFAGILYTGSPTNNTAQNGYMEFYGLETLVNTGYRDAVTGVACPAADSLVWTFSDQIVNLNAANQTQIVNMTTYMYRNLKYIARQARLMPVEWVMPMSFGLFYELTAIWPISYNTYRDVVTTSGQTVFNNGSDLTQMRDEMRRGEFLLIDGERVPVIIDDALPETNIGNGVFESSIYFIPLTVLGRVPVTYMEAFDFTAPGAAMQFANVFTPQGSIYASDGGRFIWNRPAPTNMCVQLRAWTKPRLLLLTPQIAGHITDVRYQPLVHQRSAFPDNAYFVNGGSTNYQGYPGVAPSLFPPTA